MAAAGPPDDRGEGPAVAASPDDPGFPLQWGEHDTGQSIPTQEAGGSEPLGPPANGTPGVDEDALRAWEVSTGSHAVVIGELDTGVQYAHPDLAANIWTNPGGIGGCPAGSHGFDAVGRSCNPVDEDETYAGHGTHVAGVMGAVGDNGAGVAGVNWQTSILPVRWVRSAGEETSELADALQWLLQAREEGVNIRVVNDSLTFLGTPFSAQVKKEIEALGEHNVLFVTAAGNTGDDNDNESVRRYPCGYGLANELCVTATNNRAELPAWANYGPHTVDLSAPGVSIYSTLREGRYGYLTGGSMASAQVAGAAALILSVAPTLTATQLKARILAGVDRLPSLEGKVRTGGTLDICRAMPGCAPPPPPPPAVATLGATSITQQGATVTGSVDPGGAQVGDCHFDYGLTTSYGAEVPCNPPPGAGTAQVAVSAALAGLRAGATYHYRVVATGPGGTSAGSDRTFSTLAPRSEDESPGGGAPRSSPPPTSSGPAASAAAQTARRIASPLAALPSLMHGALSASTTTSLIRLQLACPAGLEACAGTVRLRALAPVHLPTLGAWQGYRQWGASFSFLTVASGQFFLPAGGSAALEVPLSQRGRELLARFHRLFGVVQLRSSSLTAGTAGRELAVSVRAVAPASRHPVRA